MEQQAEYITEPIPATQPLTPAQMLDRLAELKSMRDLEGIDLQQRIDAIITDEIRQNMAIINQNYANKIAEIDGCISEIESAIKSAVLEYGATIKGQFYMAVWNKGRVSWDSKKLEGMMALVPGLSAARTEGDPSVTIRGMK